MNTNRTLLTVVLCFSLLVQISSCTRTASSGKAKVAPSNRSLTEMFARTRTIEVYEVGSELTLVARLKGRSTIEELRNKLELAQTKDTTTIFDDGDVRLKLDGDFGMPVGWISLIGGFAIRVSDWSSDGIVKHPDELVEWLAAHGITRAEKTRESDKQYFAQHQKEMSLWRAAMPSCLEPYWSEDGEFSALKESVQGSASAKHSDSESTSRKARYLNPVAQKLYSIMVEKVPDGGERTRLLLSWFGSGAGPWSGYPSYESIAEDMLAFVSTDSIVSVLRSNEKPTEVVSGAARLFAMSNNFSVDDLPADIRRLLLKHSLQDKYANNRKRALRCFQLRQSK